MIETSQFVKDTFFEAEHSFDGGGIIGAFLEIKIKIDNGGDGDAITGVVFSRNPGGKNVGIGEVDTVLQALKKIGGNAIVGIHEKDQICFCGCSPLISLVANVSDVAFNDCKPRDAVTKEASLFDRPVV